MLVERNLENFQRETLWIHTNSKNIQIENKQLEGILKNKNKTKKKFQA